MPKANETKNVKMAAGLDTKKEIKATETKAPVKAAEAKEAEVKTATKTVETKAPAKKAEAKAAESKAPAKAAESKAPAKAAEKKTTVAKKTTTKKEAKESVFIQYAGNEIEIASIVEKAKADYGKVKDIKDIRVYVKPEEGMAYYVVNGYEEGKVVL